MQTREKNVVAINLTKLMLENDNSHQGDKSIGESGVLEKILNPKDRLKHRKISVISKCVEVLLSNYKFGVKQNQATRQMLYGDVQDTVQDAIQDTKEQGTEVVEDTPTNLLQFMPIEENNTIKKEHLKTYAQLKLKNPTQSELDTFVEERGLPDELEVDAFQEWAEQFTSSLGDSDSDLDLAFRQINTDGNDYIDIQELREFLKDKGDDPLEPEEIDALFNEIDVNDDGKVSIKELKNHLMQPPAIY